MKFLVCETGERSYHAEAKSAKQVLEDKGLVPAEQSDFLLAYTTSYLDNEGRPHATCVLPDEDGTLEERANATRLTFEKLAEVNIGSFFLYQSNKRCVEFLQRRGLVKRYLEIAEVLGGER